MRNAGMRLTIHRSHVGPLPGLWGRNHYSAPHFDPEDQGGEGGEGAGGEGGEGGEGGGAPIQAHEFADLNGHVKLPGFDKPIKLSDLAEAHKLSGRNTESMKLMGQIATAIQQGRQQQQQPPRQGQQQGGRQPSGQQQGAPGGGQGQSVSDILTSLEGMDIVDGKTAANVMRQALTPIAQALVKLSQQQGPMRQSLGRFEQRDVEDSLSGEIGNVVKALKLPVVAGKSVAGSEVVNEMIRDFYYSHDEADWPKLRGETLSKMFNERFKTQRTFFRELEKSELAAATERQRAMRFTRPGGNSSGNGKPKRMLSNREASAALFAGQPQT